MVERDLGLDTEAARVGANLADRIPHCHPHRFEHPDVASRRVERIKADLVDGGDERRRAAVHDRRFRAIDLDHRIIDTEAGKGGKDVLGGGDERAGGVAQNGGKLGRGNRVHVRHDGAVLAAFDARSNERHAGPGIRRMQGKRDRQAGMNADTGQCGVVAKRCLPGDFHTPVPPTPGYRPSTADTKHMSVKYNRAVNDTRRMKRATPVAVVPSVNLVHEPRARFGRVVPRQMIPFRHRELTGGNAEVQLTLFYRLLPPSSRIRAARGSQTARRLYHGAAAGPGSSADPLAHQGSF